jgi:subtilisin family serine protease
MLKRIGLMTGLMVLALVANAQGKRAIVVLKSESTGRTVTMSAASTEAVAESFRQEHIAVESALKNLNSVVVRVESNDQLEKLRANPHVAYVDMEVMFPAPKPTMGKVYINQLSRILPLSLHTAASNKLPWGISAVNAKAAWSVSKKGAGARVMILDSGIDKDHPSIKPNFEKGKDFVQDDNQPYDYMDSIGHGTHVAGTIAAVEDSTGFTGVAPAAKVLMGRVCSEMGCSSTSIAEGIDWAMQEHVDLISMSLGGAMSPPSVRDAVSRAEQAGITIVAASGNDGSNRVGYPAALPTVLAVGAVDQTLKRAAFSQYGPELDIVAPGVEVVSSVPMGSGRDSVITVGGQEILNAPVQGAAADFTGKLEGELAHAGLGSADEVSKANVKGKIALIARGTISFTEKVLNAMHAGAIAVVVYNNEPGIVRGGIQPPEPVTVPVFIIEQSVGLDLKSQLASGKTVKMSLSMEATNFAAFDGTSMATPHVSGVVALVKATNKKLTPAQVRDIIKRTAKAPAGDNSQNEYGAGLVDAGAAVSAAAAARTQGLH